ncbi:dihydrofolate reductase family protein [bacterium]|nr:dihydrofolate reductase family protein [bacterium]
MRELILYIATSLDGFIARSSGAVDWCFIDQDYGYREFLDRVGTVVVGRRTWEQALGFEERPFGGKEIFVFSRGRTAGPDGEATIVNEPPGRFVEALKARPGSDIWLVGGAEIVAACLERDLIDRFVIHVHPLLLGGGIELFPRGGPDRTLELVCERTWESGLVKLEYVRRRSPG